jgi:peptidoglycan hydrolase-like protein with peptidoglycan-binding domain
LRFSASKACVVGIVLALVAVKTPAQSPSKPATSTKQHAGKSHHRRHGKKSSWKKRGQQGMQPDRVRAIQEALIRERYLAGEPTGTWDARTQDAMTRYQNDNGWQSKVTPDSRALIKLGLGPNYSEKEMLQLAPQPPAGAVASFSGSSAKQ